jgi:hypothetical protein
MGDVGCGCTKAHVMAHLAIVEDSERRKSWKQFPKILDCEEVGKMLL